MKGIYKITSPSNKIYIGQSINIENRLNQYKKLYTNIKNQVKLYNSLKKYGPENHIFEIIEECEELQLIERETYWKIYYNVLNVPSLCCRLDGRGGRNSIEMCIKMKQTKKDNPMTQETKNKIGKAHFGLKYSQESKVKIAKAKIGHMYYNDEWKKSISIGLANMDEQKKLNRKSKLSLANKGKPKPEGFGDNISKPILQYDLNMNPIQEWKNVSEIINNLNLNWNKDYIQKCCRNKIKSSYNFIWKYK